MASLREWADNWGASAEDRDRLLPCDRLLPGADLVLDRAAEVEATPERVFRWPGRARCRSRPLRRPTYAAMHGPFRDPQFLPCPRC